jgi:16S rRNA processing protein RimM
MDCAARSIVNPETDFVERPFRDRRHVWTRFGRGDEALTIASARVQNGRPVIGFAGFSTDRRCGAAGWSRAASAGRDAADAGDGVYYQHQLVGCEVKTVAGGPVGEVSRVDGGAGGSLLAVRGARGEVLIPLARHICVEIDVAPNGSESTRRRDCWS